MLDLFAVTQFLDIPGVGLSLTGVLLAGPLFFSAIRKRLEGGLLLAIAVVLLLTTVVDSQHTYWNRYTPSAVDILRQTALLGIFALGAAVVIIAGGIDLSSGSMIAFSGTVCATIMVLLAPDEMKNAQPIGLRVSIAAIAGALFVGLSVGSLHAWLVTVIGLPPFVATLATLVGLRSLSRAIVENVTASAWAAKSNQIQIFDQQFRYLATSVWIPVVVFLALAATAWLLMSRTVVGRHLHALGGNEQAARLSGIQTDRLKWLAYCISAMLASVAGVLYIGEESVADPQRLARGYELNAIAAAVVGGCSLQGGVGTVPGAMLGALFLRVVIDGVAKMIKTGADVYEGLIVGSVVVVAVALTQLRQTGRRGARFFGGALGLVTVLNLAILFGVLVWLFIDIFAPGLVAVAERQWGRLFAKVVLGLFAAAIALLALLLARFLTARRRRWAERSTLSSEGITGTKQSE